MYICSSLISAVRSLSPSWHQSLPLCTDDNIRNDFCRRHLAPKWRDYWKCCLWHLTRFRVLELLLHVVFLNSQHGPETRTLFRKQRLLDQDPIIKRALEISFLQWKVILHHRRHRLRHHHLPRRQHSLCPRRAMIKEKKWRLFVVVFGGGGGEYGESSA